MRLFLSGEGRRGRVVSGGRDGFQFGQTAKDRKGPSCAVTRFWGRGCRSDWDVSGGVEGALFKIGRWGIPPLPR